MLGQVDEDAATGADGLEDPVTELEAAVGDSEVRRVGRDEDAIDPDGPRGTA
jgi:hypothetical protein